MFFLYWDKLEITKLIPKIQNMKKEEKLFVILCISICK